MKKAAFWLCLVSVVGLSLLPADYLPPPVFSLWDKVQHAFAFATLVVLGRQAYANYPVLLLAAALLAVGAGIEVAQAATGWRYGEWLDLLADAVGLVVGIALLRRWPWRRIRSADGGP